MTSKIYVVILVGLALPVKEYFIVASLGPKEMIFQTAAT
jgi:hypothetical protein